MAPNLSCLNMRKTDSQQGPVNAEIRLVSDELKCRGAQISKKDSMSEENEIKPLYEEKKRKTDDKKKKKKPDEKKEKMDKKKKQGKEKKQKAPTFFKWVWPKPKPIPECNHYCNPIPNRDCLSHEEYIELLSRPLNPIDRSKWWMYYPQMVPVQIPPITQRLNQLALPSRRLMLATWQNHAHLLTAKRVEIFKKNLSSLETTSNKNAIEIIEQQEREERSNELRKNKKLLEIRRLLRAKNEEALKTYIVKMFSQMKDYLKTEVNCPVDDVNAIADKLVKVICHTLKIRVPKYQTSFKGKVLKGAAEKLSIWLQNYLAPSSMEEFKSESKLDEVQSVDSLSIPSGAYPIEDYIIYSDGSCEVIDLEMADAPVELDEIEIRDEMELNEIEEDMKDLVEDVLASFLPFGFDDENEEGLNDYVPPLEPTDQPINEPLPLSPSPSQEETGGSDEPIIDQIIKQEPEDEDEGKEENSPEQDAPGETLENPPEEGEAPEEDQPEEGLTVKEEPETEENKD